MRNSDETEDDVLRATFEVPRSLVDAFRALAKRRERTLSAQLRQSMRDELDREAERDRTAA
jgi:hypothetical protein